MALSDTGLRKLRPRKKAYQRADGGGLFIEVMPGGKKVWRLRYRLRSKQEKVTLGSYRAYWPHRGPGASREAQGDGGAGQQPYEGQVR